MDNLPVDPGIGDKRPRGMDEQDDELGNNIPPNLRNTSNNVMNQGMQQRGMQQQQWQGPGPGPGPGNQMIPGGLNMAAANATLDALYVGDLNWVCTPLPVLAIVVSHTILSGQRTRTSAASLLSSELSYS